MKKTATAIAVVILLQLMGLAFSIGVFLTDHVWIIQAYCVWVWISFGFMFVWNMAKGMRG